MTNNDATFDPADWRVIAEVDLNADDDHFGYFTRPTKAAVA